jgi:hypothetical protein
MEDLIIVPFLMTSPPLSRVSATYEIRLYFGGPKGDFRLEHMNAFCTKKISSTIIFTNCMKKYNKQNIANQVFEIISHPYNSDFK